MSWSRQCDFCGLTFQYTHGPQKYCTPACSREARNARDRAKYDKPTGKERLFRKLVRRGLSEEAIPVAAALIETLDLDAFKREENDERAA